MDFDVFARSWNQCPQGFWWTTLFLELIWGKKKMDQCIDSGVECPVPLKSVWMRIPGCFLSKFFFRICLTLCI